MDSKLEIVERLSEAQIDELLSLYQQEWWTKGRTLSDVRRMLEGCDVVIAFVEAEGGRLAAFVRVITDGVYKALVLDVIVAPAYRGSGLGRQVMDTLLEHPGLRGVRHFELYCLPELMPFYEKWGFTANLGDLKFMRLAR